MARPKKTAAPAPAYKSEIDQMREIGMTDAEIRETILRRNNPIVTIDAAGTVTQIAPEPPRLGVDVRAANAQQAQDKAALGPDPELVARLEAYRRNRPPTPQPETFTVTLDSRRADFVRQKAIVLSHRRNETVSTERAIALLVAAAWQIDPDRLLLTAGASGPRTAFNPATGTYG